MSLVSRGRQAPTVKLSKQERESLQGLIRRSTAAQRDVWRAKLALMVHEGHATSAIASALGLSRPTVTLWRERLACFGLEGLQEAPRPGRPRRIAEAQRLQLLALACEPAEEGGRATPTLDEVCERAVAQDVVEHISRSHLHRILQAGDVRPHRVRQWLHSPDPQFREKVNAICELYRRAPRDSVVLSIDEKTGIQAIERKHADRAPAPGRARRREFEYIRHGTQALTAALDGMRSAIPSSAPIVKLRTLHPDVQRRGQDGHGSTRNGALPGAGCGISGLGAEGERMVRGERRAAARAVELVRARGSLAGQARWRRARACGS